MLEPAEPTKVTAGGFWRLLPAGMRRRWWLFRTTDAMQRSKMLARARKGVLVIRMDGIGDMVLFRNSLDDYAKAFGVPKEQIFIVGCKSWESVADHVFDGYHVMAIDEHKYAKRLLYRIWVNARVRRLNVAVTVCDAYFRRALMADSLARVAGAPKTIMSLPYINGPTRAEYAWYLSQVSDVIDTGPYPRHEIERHAAFIAHFTGDAPAPKAPKLPWRENPPPLPTNGPTNGPTDKPYAVLNPGSNEYGRRWPMAQYIELAGWLAAQGLRVVFIGKADEKAAAIPASDAIIDLTGKTTLPEMFDLMQSAALVVSNDTGPAHVAIGLGAPSVVIVGGGHFGCFVPYPESVRPETARFVYRRMDCYHCFWRCHKREDAKASFPCVEAVGMDQVQEACSDVLKAAPAK
ncbi:MAG: glycosyltransferase family 9 protein [Rhodospirillaceae bacterium]|jgi:ADP-heptose:LPS heptosyltransferase|nr:glycosyltransferase family 9 protein [Rhodospirillaceae bacterium]